MSSRPDQRPAYLVPSILAADFTRLGDQVAEAVAAGADRFQVDIMDGHFVPNISMGPMFVATVRRLLPKAMPLEAHLMVGRPEQWIEAVAQAGANIIIVHAEATVHMHSLLAQIRAAGARSAVALNPASPLALIEEAVDQAAMVLQMTVEPGFGGQQFIPDVLPKIRRLRELLDHRRLDCDIEVDGGIEVETIASAREAGANVFVAGSSVFAHPQGSRAGLAALRAALTPAGTSAPRR